MDELEVAGHPLAASEIAERFETAGGPGGQHSNRNATAVYLSFDVDASSLPEDIKRKLIARLGEMVTVTASDSRSQHRNREVARQRLREKLEGALADPKPRRRTKPTKSSRVRRLSDKRARSKKKSLRKRPAPED